jgi:hypothetical protein
MSGSQVTNGMAAIGGAARTSVSAAPVLTKKAQRIEETTLCAFASLRRDRKSG